LKRHEEALSHYDHAIQLKPDYAEAWSNKGITLHELKRHEEALSHYDHAIQLKPDYAEAWSNKGITLHELKRLEEALSHYDHTIQLKPDYAEAWFNKGVTLHELKRREEALSHYDHAIQLKPDYTEAWSNKGVILHELKRLEEALSHYDHAIQLKPDYAEAWANKGVTLNDLKYLEEALSHYDHAIQLKPDYAEAWSNKGVVFTHLKLHDEALLHYKKAIELKPDFDFLLGQLIHTKMNLADWRGLGSQLDALMNGINNNKKTTPPFPLLSAIDSPDLQLHAAKLWATYIHPVNSSLPALPRPHKHNKIRIGYFSQDFKSHPVSFLMAELFEIHDRNCFEIVGFSLQRASEDDEMRGRLVEAFNQFIDVENKSDLEVAQLARRLEIDIAVDLGGHTKDSRTGIFAHRAAPIQVNYLGYPGTMGTEYIDYIIADKTVIPEDSQSFYAEKMVYLPGCFQVNDSHKLISRKHFSRRELGLPDEGFIFCCFNNNYKINPRIFESWMRILKNTKNSFLWVLADSEMMQTNLRNEAKRLGIDPTRLIVAGRLPISEYLARYRLADLFLDTLPFNAGATASDALWAGLPVLTQIGKSFAGRMAASLLRAIKLPELITQNQEEYEYMAIELATDPDKLNRIKQKLAENRMTTPLFDTPLFTRHLEAAYTQMHQRHQAGLTPDHLHIKAED
ncbi:MAG: tetratricopeptide repeat protein, partial [Betaproteobacteria bacterium]